MPYEGLLDLGPCTHSTPAGSLCVLCGGLPKLYVLGGRAGGRGYCPF